MERFNSSTEQNFCWQQNNQNKNKYQPIEINFQFYFPFKFLKPHWVFPSSPIIMSTSDDSANKRSSKTIQKPKLEQRVLSLERDSSLGCLLVKGAAVPKREPNEKLFTKMASLILEHFNIRLMVNDVDRCWRLHTKQNSPVIIRYILLFPSFHHEFYHFFILDSIAHMSRVSSSASQIQNSGQRWRKLRCTFQNFNPLMTQHWKMSVTSCSNMESWLLLSSTRTASHVSRLVTREILFMWNLRINFVKSSKITKNFVWWMTSCLKG